ncbi:MAG: biotin--[acetyl-CoA-carboxylase] ligase [Campylobacterales bacterium]|nr:biotin--[acetyl-CoA-carboxylase] ligase [Campylobacterales bacterium]
MKIIALDKIDSTHKYLKEYLQKNSPDQNICFYTQNQTNGIGSRNNSWIGCKGNLFFSFCCKTIQLPTDLPMQSYSIYFSYLLKMVLSQYGSKLWIKWPNDFYLDEKKIGGTITNKTNHFILCGIGLNLQEVDEQFGYLDILIDPMKILQEYFALIDDKISWKQIFSNYRIEFEQYKKYTATIDGVKKSLNNASLNHDGSINLDKQKVYSLR